MFGYYEFLTIVLCGITSIVIIYATIRNHRRYKTMTVFQIASYFYCIIYAIVPTYFMLNPSEAPLKIFKHYNTITQVYAALLGLVIYLIFLASYEIGGKIRFKKKVEITKRLPIRKYQLWALIGFFLGLLGILVEIRMYGGLSNAINSIGLVRGFKSSEIKDGVNNPLVFLRMLKPFMLFSFYVFYSLFRITRKKRHRLMSLVSFIFASYVIFVNGGRTHLVIFLATILVGFLFSTKKKNTKETSFKKVIIMLLFAAIGVASLIVLDPIVRHLTYGSEIDFSESAGVEDIMSQFTFPFANLMFILSSTFGFRYFQDLFSWILTIVPSFLTSRIGLSRPEPLYEYNTILQNDTMLHGGIPDDIITLGYYQLGFAGVIVILILFGVIVARTDKLMFNIKHIASLKPVVFRIVVYLGMIVMYADMEGTFRGRFDVILLLLLLYDFQRYIKYGENSESTLSKGKSVNKKAS